MQGRNEENSDLCRGRGCDASLGGDVAAGRGGDGDGRGGQQRGDDGQRQESRPVVAVDHGGGTAVIGSPVVEARGPDVPPLPGTPVVPLEAVVVARHRVLVVWEGTRGAELCRGRRRRRGGRSRRSRSRGGERGEGKGQSGSERFCFCVGLQITIIFVVD